MSPAITSLTASTSRQSPRSTASNSSRYSVCSGVSRRAWTTGSGCRRFMRSVSAGAGRGCASHGCGSFSAASGGVLAGFAADRPDHLPADPPMGGVAVGDHVLAKPSMSRHSRKHARAVSISQTFEAP